MSANNLPALVNANDLRVALEDRGFDLDKEIEKLCKSLSKTLKSEKRFTEGDDYAKVARALDVRLRHQIAYLKLLIDLRERSGSSDDSDLDKLSTAEVMQMAESLLKKQGGTLEKTTFRLDPPIDVQGGTDDMIEAQGRADLQPTDRPPPGAGGGGTQTP